MKCKLPLLSKPFMALFFLMQFLQPSASNAQGGICTIKGIVHVDSNEPIAGVSVLIHNSQTNFSSGTKTDSSGIFTANLPAGGP